MIPPGRPGIAPGDRDATKRDRRDLLLYSLLVIGTTNLLVAFFPSWHVSNNWVVNALMFIPGLMALGLRLQGRQGFRSVGWGAGSSVYWLWGIMLPIIALVISLPISIRLGYVALAQGSSTGSHLITHPMRILENIGLYTAISIPFAFGEEFGWRGYAQARFVRQYGLAGGLLLLGIIWGLWHTPIYCFVDAYPKHPILGPFVMTPLDNVLAAVPMAWLYLRSGSIWVPTLTHAFADVLWGFSGLIFPSTQEVGSWAVLQVVQLMISIVLLVDLKGRSENRDASPNAWAGADRGSTTPGGVGGDAPLQLIRQKSLLPGEQFARTGRFPAALPRRGESVQTRFEDELNAQPHGRNGPRVTDTRKHRSW